MFFFVAVVVVVVFSQDSHGVYVKIPGFSVDKTEKCILCIIFLKYIYPIKEKEASYYTGKRTTHE